MYSYHNIGTFLPAQPCFPWCSSISISPFMLLAIRLHQGLTWVNTNSGLSNEGPITIQFGFARWQRVLGPVKHAYQQFPLCSHVTSTKSSALGKKSGAHQKRRLKTSPNLLRNKIHSMKGANPQILLRGPLNSSATGSKIRVHSLKLGLGHCLPQ